MTPRMRPLTKALFDANSERLAKRGYKLTEQRQVFKKVDELLDYISEYSTQPVVQKGGFDSRFIKDDFQAGMDIHLSRNMPSLKKQGLALEVLNTLLSMGQEIVVRAAWLYRNYPVIYKRNYASSIQAYQKDSHFFMMKGHTVPTHSFTSFKTGENPALSRDNDFSKRCAEMYSDPIFQGSQFLKYDKTTKTDEDFFVRWLHSTKAGRHFHDLDCVLMRNIMPNLVSSNTVNLRLDKAHTKQKLIQKKQKTI